MPKAKYKNGAPAKRRCIRAPDALWDRFRREARARGISVSALLIEAGRKRLATEGHGAP